MLINIHLSFITLVTSAFHSYWSRVFHTHTLYMIVPCFPVPRFQSPQSIMCHEGSQPPIFLLDRGLPIKGLRVESRPTDKLCASDLATNVVDSQNASSSTVNEFRQRQSHAIPNASVLFSRRTQSDWPRGCSTDKWAPDRAALGSVAPPPAECIGHSVRMHLQGNEIGCNLHAMDGRLAQFRFVAESSSRWSSCCRCSTSKCDNFVDSCKSSTTQITTHTIGVRRQNITEIIITFTDCRTSVYTRQKRRILLACTWRVPRSPKLIK